MLAESAQPTQHVRDVAAEHAAQRVELVDDDVAQAQQERGPPSCVGRMPMCSISGLVSTTLACVRIHARSSVGVSPS